MIGRPRRRHVIDRQGRLRQATAAKAASTSPAERPSNPRHQTRHSQFNSLILKRVAIGLAGLVAIFLLWAVIGSVLTLNKVTDSNSTKKSPVLSFLGEVNPNQLQGEGDGRVNVLLIGVGGSKHPGGTLADTIIVASLDPKNKEAALLSLPRDLYVPIHGNGYGKINSAHSYGESNAKKTGGGPAVMKKTVSQILDLPIHYYIRVDFMALEKIVDTLGGVTVDVENPIVDLSYPADNMIDYAPFRLAAGTQTLNGKTALKYARSRHGSGGEGSDFARAKRQQKLIEAIKAKALTAGVLANPKKMTDLLGILGDHVKTDIAVKEMERFVQLWKDVDQSKIVTKVLDNGPNGPLVSHSGDGRGYILEPRTGDFSEVQQIAHEIFTDPYLRQEKAAINFVNATGSTTTGRQVVQQLKSYGYTVTDVTPAGQKSQKSVELTDYTGTKPYTVKFLESRFKVKAQLRKDRDAESDLLLVVGTDYKPIQVKSQQQTRPRVTPKASPSPVSQATNDQNEEE